MADKYRNFEALSRHEKVGSDFRILVRRAKGTFAIVAPHGGGIEAGTSDIADAIAGEDFSFYAFEGLKKKTGNTDLHITSTRFDEPMCLALLGVSDVIITIHGEHTDVDGEGVFLGGLDDDLGGRLGEALEGEGFEVRRHPDRRLQGLEHENICNRGASGEGVQFELSRTVRKTLFSSLTRDGLKSKTDRFDAFVAAIRGVLV